ncbi:hypothetical protein MSAN_02355600 [Mycena sanguinolenta]|uniref:Uncharacterized protein n=1 Tax=Mycena sanguinolenta TaxID=230812 RepID=A0A8H6X646_9AGAR|nr:hypothetical protein MSAN_02355600 [Mycena sanguinolenta]
MPQPLCDCTLFGCSRGKGGVSPVGTYQIRQHHRRKQAEFDLLQQVQQDQAEQQKLEREAKEQERKRRTALERAERREEEQSRRRHGVDEALEAIRRTETDEAALLSQLSLPTPASEAERPDRDYRRDRELRQVDVWAKLMDVQEELSAELDLLNSPPQSLDLEGLRAGVSMIEKLAHRSSVLKRHLMTMRCAKGFSSTQALRDSAWDKALQHDAAIENALGAWNTEIMTILQQRTNDSATKYDTSHLFAPILPNSFPVQVILFMVVVCSTILAFSRRGCSWLFGMSRAALSNAFDMASDRSPSMGRIEQTFPRDRVPNVTIFMPLAKQIPVGRIRKRCNYQRYNRGKKCKAILTRPATVAGVVRQVPIKPFVSFDFRDWLARLLAREGNEEKMDKKWDHLKKDPTTMTEAELEAEAAAGLSDVFDGYVVRSFKGPDGERHFKEADTPGEGRYLFSLGFDFFNPLTNKMAGKKLSVGAFSLVCLNLPVEERYKPENMFLAGIIPGPKEPPLDSVNSYWGPLVDCFEELWYHGIYLTRTHAHQDGRLVRCAIIMLVCDLPAARKIAGMASCRHQWFCSRCLCTRDVKRKGKQGGSRKGRRKRAAKKDAEDQADEEKREKEEEVLWQELAADDDEQTEEAGAQHEVGIGEGAHFEGPVGNRVGYNNYDIDSWTLRSSSQCREWAELYRTAPTQRDAQACFDKTGLRWTEFLRLPYFDLPTMVVVDSMHNLFLGLLKEHFRHILGLRSTKSKKKQSNALSVIDISIGPSPDNPLPTKPTELKTLEKALNALSEPMTSRLNNPTERSEISRSGVWKKLHAKSALYIAKGLGCKDLYHLRLASGPVDYSAAMAQLENPATGTDEVSAAYVETDKAIKRDEIVAKILDWRASQAEKVQEQEQEQEHAPEVELFTQAEKEALWSDLATMVKPSWMTSVPSQVGGESSDGKLKSDQWRTLGTKYLPITLIRLWHASENPQRRELLNLTMDLVSAIILASSPE